MIKCILACLNRMPGRATYGSLVSDFKSPGEKIVPPTFLPVIFLFYSSMKVNTGPLSEAIIRSVRPDWVVIHIPVMRTQSRA